MKEQATILEVEGMTCPSCVTHISSALTELAGVGGVDVQLRDGVVVVTHDDARAPVGQLIDALQGAGYASKQRPMSCPAVARSPRALR